MDSLYKIKKMSFDDQVLVAIEAKKKLIKIMQSKYAFDQNDMKDFLFDILLFLISADNYTGKEILFVNKVYGLNLNYAKFKELQNKIKGDFIEKMTDFFGIINLDARTCLQVLAYAFFNVDGTYTKDEEYRFNCMALGSDYLQ